MNDKMFPKDGENAHECGDYEFQICRQIVHQDHLCYMQNMKKKNENEEGEDEGEMEDEEEIVRKTKRGNNLTLGISFFLLKAWLLIKIFLMYMVRKYSISKNIR